MAEENKNIKVNIIKKAAAPEVAKKAVEEVVEKKKVVVKLKTPVKPKQVIKVKGQGKDEKENTPEVKPQPSSPEKSNLIAQSRPQFVDNPRVQGQQRPTRPGEKPQMAPIRNSAQKEAPKREVIEGKSFMGSTTHNGNTRI